MILLINIIKMDLRKISFRPTREEIDYLTRQNTQRYLADTVTKLMHAFLTDIMYNSNNGGYSNHFKSNNMLNMADRLEGIDVMPMHPYNFLARIKYY
jgi:hypothetical protein